eukprot:CAMPEP_0113506552 /NCGR_PEP_ID=MMETSP0014_2-20120614/35969_1 /TAXON_ID=2857 /ORGANISM="Nitzschia sp." /LENGTH=43 /DNA_ID=CAMNT_0000402055 /DNA_START=1721 /DNA_END=1849 /DNA_ORIENTATION=- /assembly_acc=CAM_ASM_000159
MTVQQVDGASSAVPTQMKSSQQMILALDAVAGILPMSFPVVLH